MVKLDELLTYCDSQFENIRLKDYCPNGLQIEGVDKIQRLLTGVTANLALIEAAIAWHADAILVHHGYFWRGEAEPLVGLKGKRVRALIKNDINLLAYHLPLDVHPEFGNNRRLGEVLGLCDIEPTALEQGLIWQGCLPKPLSVEGFAQLIADKLARTPMYGGCHPEPISRVAWCTGGAQKYLLQAATLGVDAYVSGEISEQSVHEAKELGLQYFSAGHHATERYGIQAFGERLAQRYDLEVRFVDVVNPA